jgi:CheY-like chemotaxis protein
MYTILLVDDSPVTLRVLADRLTRAGLGVREEPSAAAARAVDPGALSCAVLDIELPDGCGTELAAELRARSPSLPVAFFTSSEPGTAIDRARAHGPVFSKPDLDALIAWVTRQPPPTK